MHAVCCAIYIRSSLDCTPYLERKATGNQELSLLLEDQQTFRQAACSRMRLVAVGTGIICNQGITDGMAITVSTVKLFWEQGMFSPGVSGPLRHTFHTIVSYGIRSPVWGFKD